MKVDRNQFMEQGYLILRNVIPPDKLEALRASCETILDRQKAVWTRERGPNEPPGGEYETVRQPRVHMERPGLIDEQTANVIEDFWVADETLDIASQILCNPQPNVSSMMMMCNPVRDWPGGTGWHRDVHPVDMAPMDALAADLIENGPRYTQWNVPMYDDSVLWVVPGSHRRRNTERENSEFMNDMQGVTEVSNDRLQAAAEGIPVELNAGDGVIYSNFLLHTGSNYTTKKRRTLHGGHTIFGQYPELGFADSLSPEARGKFETFARREAQMKDATEAALRAVIEGDAIAYRAALEQLQPGAGSHGKTVLTIYLSKAALHIRALKDPGVDVTDETRRRASNAHTITLNWGPEFADRFTDEDSMTLWARFQTLDAMLQGEEEMYEPSFQSGPLRYYFSDLPEGVDTESFILGWGRSA